MNILMQIAGLGVLIVLLCFYVRRKTVGLYTEIIFKWALLIMLADVTTDILSIVAIVYREMIPAILCNAICKLYLIFLVLTCFCTILYICQDIYHGVARIRAQWILTFFAMIGIVCIILLPIYIYAEGNITYTYGPSVLTTYVFSLSFVILTLILLICKRRQMNPARVSAVTIWLIMWICAAAIQFFNSHLLLVGYSGCIGMMILYFKLENPEANIDRSTGAFNAHAFVNYLEQLYNSNKSVSLMLIRMDHYGNEGNTFNVRDMLDIARFLNTLNGAKVFKLIEYEFILLYDDKDKFEEGKEKVTKHFRQMCNSLCIIIRDSQIAESADEISQLLYYYKLEYKQYCGEDDKIRIFEIDRKMVEERRNEMLMLNKISTALKEDRVEAFLQPIYSVKKDRFTSAEALARIRDTDGTIIPPGKFIPTAEKYGLVDQIGERMFEKVCQFMQREHAWEWGIEYIEVNLSVKQCESHTLVSRYKSIMDKYSIQPDAINLEVTESATIQNKSAVLQNMGNLIDFGVSFSLDDFGSGESNLNYIVDMPVDIVKFDRDMTNSYFESPKGKLVMETAISMILELHLKIVAEGVETKQQLDAMKQLGVQYIQGYYFSQPLPENKFMEFVKEHNKI